MKLNIEIIFSILLVNFWLNRNKCKCDYLETYCKKNLNKSQSLIQISSNTIKLRLKSLSDEFKTKEIDLKCFKDRNDSQLILDFKSIFTLYFFIFSFQLFCDVPYLFIKNCNICLIHAKKKIIFC